LLGGKEARGARMGIMLDWGKRGSGPRFGYRREDDRAWITIEERRESGC
jgi:hypothetical protein